MGGREIPSLKWNCPLPRWTQQTHLYIGAQPMCFSRFIGVPWLHLQLVFGGPRWDIWTPLAWRKNLRTVVCAPEGFTLLFCWWGDIQQDSFWEDETHPRHPNASWECILGMFGGVQIPSQEVFNYLKIMISTFGILPFPVYFVSRTSGEPWTLLVLRMV